MTETLSELGTGFPSRLTNVPETATMGRTMTGTLTIDETLSSLRSPTASEYTSSHMPRRPSRYVLFFRTKSNILNPAQCPSRSRVLSANFPTNT
jgi:hypothetical protein